MKKIVELSLIILMPFIGFSQELSAKEKKKAAKVAAKKTELANYYLSMGMMAQAKGKYKKAVEHYTKLLEQRPNDQHGLLSRGICFMQLKDMKSACTDWNKGKELGDPKAIEWVDSECKK